MSKKPTTKKHATVAAKAGKLPGEDIDFGEIANKGKKTEKIEDNDQMRFPEELVITTREDAEKQEYSTAVSQKQAQPFPTVSQNSGVVEQPKPEKKVAGPKKITSTMLSKSKPMKVKEDKPQESIKSEKVNDAAVAATPSEPVDAQKIKVKNINKSTKENKDKKKEKGVKSKAEPKKKDKHKPFRRGHDIDLDSKVKSEFFSMRLSGKELETLSKKAAKAHMSTSTYARETLLSSVPREALSEKEKIAMDKAYTMLDDANFNVRQMSNYFHSMLSEKDKDGKEKYERLTWKELKTVIYKQKAVLDFLNNEFKIYK